MKPRQIVDFIGQIEDIKQNITSYKYMDSYTTERYLVHDKSIQLFQYKKLKLRLLSFSENIVYKQIVEHSKRLQREKTRGSAEFDGQSQMSRHCVQSSERSHD